MHNTCNINNKITLSVLFIEREQFLGAGHYERLSWRRGHANGLQEQKVDILLRAL